MKSKDLLKVALVLCIGMLFGLGAVETKSKKEPSIIEGAKAIQSFDVEKYLGQWYEIARLDFRYEKGLSKVTAGYSMNNDGSIKVVNRGYNDKKGKWQEQEGKAVFAGDTNEGMLMVSFFGPIYSGYNVIALDNDYKYALVTGKNTDYVWFLSREKTMPDSIRKKYLVTASDLGYDVSKLVWTKQD